MDSLPVGFPAGGKDLSLPRAQLRYGKGTPGAVPSLQEEGVMEERGQEGCSG